MLKNNRTEEVIQEEEEGLDRSTQKIKSKWDNCFSLNQLPVKPAVPKIILKGEKKPTNR